LKQLKSTDSALNAKTKEFVVMPTTLDVGQLSKILVRHEAVFIQKRSEDKSKLLKIWIASASDIFKFIK
jgi:hypothetical protein